ncbi:MAG: aminoacyl-tRNA hydrolase [Candidatus Omnitrophica bacterium]|nr:aminoacyl-tRNA hydrolase [Candidatus Omnitrophota bacterium]
MKFIIGLGNPGFRYRNTRHNIGFLITRELSRKFRIPVTKAKNKSLFGIGSIEGVDVELIMPQTYMNLSGEAVLKFVYKENANTEDILVIYDDIDLKYGSIRLREKGTSAGHKGLESIITSLKTDNFPRLRAGIGRDTKPEDVSRFVLEPFDREERKCLNYFINEAAMCAVSWVTLGANKAMSLYNRR